MQREKCEQILTEKKINPTAMRILTLDFLLEQTSAVSLTDVENYFVRSDRITLYRTLKTFEEKGLIHSIQENNTTKYSLCQDSCSDHIHNHHHLHFYCTQCKKTVCLHQVDVSNIKIPSTYKVEQLRFFAKGICEDCLNKSLQ